ncbi:MAG: omptin family outer membrane protease [Pirellulales bacterium]|nr:omptin family outer membrane protease [Pirellulales bacterium]
MKLCHRGFLCLLVVWGVTSFAYGADNLQFTSTAFLADDTTAVKADGETKAATDACGCCPCEPACCDCGCCCCCCDPPVWTADYRVRPMFNSHTTYEFGTAPQLGGPQYTPLSRLRFQLDSVWHGLQLGVKKSNWGLHFEWLTPIARNINGQMADYDWNINQPRTDPTRLDSLTLSNQRWNDGQMLDLGGEFKWLDSILDYPVEVWPTAGFRFQRFNITAYDIDSQVPNLGPVYTGDVITFNQQYYVAYLGAQLRSTVYVRRPVNLTFQADWGPTWAYNVDHHLLRTPAPRYTMENTSGGTLHFSLIGEVPIREHLSVGLQADHIEIRTWGTHRLTQPGLDLSWTNGVKVTSDQTSLTAFLRYNY